MNVPPVPPALDKLRIAASSFVEKGHEIERPLQIALGAIVLALLSSLATVWVDMSNPLAPLRVIYVSAIADFGKAFLLVVALSGVRLVLLSKVDIARERLRTIVLGAWYGALSVVVVSICISGANFLGAMREVTLEELAVAERQAGIVPDEERSPLDRIPALREVEASKTDVQP